jgi:GNAT superfamily N-acetyltransferase
MLDAPLLRLATLEDEAAINDLMEASIRDIFPQFYDAAQTESSVRYVGIADRMLIEDGTYFVAEVDGELVACGGWSKRHKLYTGSGDAEGDERLLDPSTEPAHIRAMFVRPDWPRRGLGRRILEACEAAARADGFQTLALLATLPGELLYASYGFRELGHEMVTFPDGVAVDCIAMEKRVE